MENPLERLMETRAGQRALGLFLLGFGLALGALQRWLPREAQDGFASLHFLVGLAVSLGAGVALVPGHGRGRGGELDRPPCALFLVAGVLSVIYGIWALGRTG